MIRGGGREKAGSPALLLSQISRSRRGPFSDYRGGQLGCRSWARLAVGTVYAGASRLPPSQWARLVKGGDERTPVPS